MTEPSLDRSDEQRLGRSLWQHVEIVHAVVYFDPTVADAVAGAGVEGWWAGYVAGRSAPLGEVPAEVVQALFHGFALGRIRRRVPDAWQGVAPHDLVRVRTRAVGQALRRLAPEHLDDDVVHRACALADRAIDGADTAGRALYAAHLALPDPDDPMERLWHRCTLLREHRGDGHVAVLVGAGLGGAAANRFAAARGVVPDGDVQRRNRGWSDAEWSDAADELRRRGLLDGDDVPTAAGARVAADLEACTDAAASGPVRALGVDGVHELVELVSPLVAAVLDSGLIGFPNAVGVPRP